KLVQRLEAHNEEESGVSGAYNKFLRNSARLVTGDKTLKGENKQARGEVLRDIANLDAVLAKGGETSATAIERAANNCEKVADRMSSSGGDGTNGRPPKPTHH